MSRPLPQRLATAPQLPGRRLRPTRISSQEGKSDSATARRASLSKQTAPKTALRTSKTSHKLVVLPSEVQTKTILEEDEQNLGYETDAGVRVIKSEAERMTKEQRKRAGYPRLTAYCVADNLKMKLLASFLKREHNVSPRVFDDALYSMYHLPLLPGYGPHANLRSSVPGEAESSRLSEAEENGYQGSYFNTSPTRKRSSARDGYISSSSPVHERRIARPSDTESSNTTDAQSDSDTETEIGWNRGRRSRPQTKKIVPTDNVVEVIFFEYGVAVFFGFTEEQELAVLEDISNAGILNRKRTEDDWEIEECHYTHDPNIERPRIFNDFFTLKSRSHLLKLSIAHALAQSTLLAHFETNTQRVLSSKLTMSIPRQLAQTGGLQLRRHEALKLTGRLFKLRRDVNLVSNVLDIPELFWSEASLKELYDAVRDYMEIKGRVQVLNDRLSVASDFLEAIHDHLNNSAMERITWIIILLIVVAIVVELGEVVARLIVHATTANSLSLAAMPIKSLGKDEALRTLELMMRSS
jgi:uncharacterized Rmd1/YagE family protein